MHPALAAVLALGAFQLAELATGRSSDVEATLLALLGAAVVGGVAQMLRPRRAPQRTPRTVDSAPVPDAPRSISHLSHELRTPLTTIIGLSELMEVAPDAGSPRENARRIRKNGQQLLAVIEDIVALSRLDAGLVPKERHPIPLANLLEAVRMRFREALESGQAEIEVVQSPDCPKLVLADAALAMLALRCLVDNAVKFGAGGKVRVEATRGERDQVRIHVRDDGPGVDDAALEEIFDPFRQGDESAARDHEGAGVGLALARKAARAIGGEVEPVRTGGRGGCFVLLLSGADLGAALDSAAGAGAGAEEPTGGSQNDPFGG